MTSVHTPETIKDGTIVRLDEDEVTRYLVIHVYDDPNRHPVESPKVWIQLIKTSAHNKVFRTDYIVTLNRLWI